MKMTYTRVGDYYIPNLKVEQEERSIGKWGRMHREYLREYRPIRFNHLSFPASSGHTLPT